MTLVNLSYSVPAFAASKTASIRVSCTIKPIMEIGGSSSPAAYSNLDRRQYRMSECLQDRGSQKVRLYSLTAL